MPIHKLKTGEKLHRSLDKGLLLRGSSGLANQEKIDFIRKKQTQTLLKTTEYFQNTSMNQREKVLITIEVIYSA